MGKYFGAIGYAVTKETRPGVWTNNITEREVYGDVIRNTKRTENSEKANEDISVSVQISFLADPYALQNFHLIKYAKYLGVSWKVTIVDEAFPRLILTLGGLYHDGQ